MKKKYSWSRPNQYAVPAQKFGEWTERLPDTQPSTVIEAARDPKSIAHALFEWDKTKAAEQYRLLQARLLFTALIVDVVIYKRNKPETHRVRAIMRTSRQGDYETADAAFSQPDKRNYVLSQALAQLRALKRRYASLSELALVFAAIDKVERKRA